MTASQDGAEPVFVDSDFSVYTKNVVYHYGDKLCYCDIKHPAVVISYGGSNMSVDFVKELLPVAQATLWGELERTFPTFQHRVTHGWCYGDPGATMDCADRVKLHLPVRGTEIKLSKTNIQIMFRLVHRLYNFPKRVQDHIKESYGEFDWE
jgi:hypothetical protein